MIQPVPLAPVNLGVRRTGDDEREAIIWPPAAKNLRIRTGSLIPPPRQPRSP